MGPLYSMECLSEVLLPIRPQTAAALGVEVHTLLLRPTVYPGLDPPFYIYAEQGARLWLCACKSVHIQLLGTCLYVLALC